MVQLYKVDSPINREQRNNINATFADILIRFTNLKYQISILSGGEDLDAVLQRIEDAISDANGVTANTQQVLDEITDALNQLQSALTSSQNATDAAGQAVLDLQTEINRVQGFIDNLGNAESYVNSKTYQKNNVVEYNGSSFMAIQETTGNLPPTLPDKRNAYWQLLAQRGIDGTGSVSSVNGVSPDVNGNIELQVPTLNQFEALETTANEHFNNQDIHMINVKSFGAKFDGTTDDTAAIQAAIDYLETLGGGDLYCPRGTAIITNTINIAKPITIIGQGDGSDTRNTNGELVSVSAFRWTGARNGVMFLVKSATPDNYLFGGGFRNILLNGSSEAGVGIQCSSVGYMNFEKLKIREVIADGLKIDAENGVLSQFNRISEYHFVYGANDAVKNANGLYLGDSDGGLVTQTHVLSITGLVMDGSLIKIGFSDNNIFEKIGGAVIGNGYNLYLANGDRVAANSNLIKYMGGRVYAESNTFGNRIMHYISEGGGIFAEEGAQLHYEVEDYQTSDIQKTHTYRMTDRKHISVGELANIQGAMLNQAALQWPSLSMPKTTSSKIGLTLPPVYDWNNGTIEAIRVYYSTETANANASFRARITALTNGTASGIATPEVETTISIPVLDIQYITNHYDIILNIPYNRGDFVFFALQRLATDSSDTVTGSVEILGLEIVFKSKGATSGGSGTYAITEPYINSSRL